MLMGQLFLNMSSNGKSMITMIVGGDAIEGALSYPSILCLLQVTSSVGTWKARWIPRGASGSVRSWWKASPAVSMTSASRSGESKTFKI